ncbi:MULTISPECIES: hypothetical protein [Streptomyces violaceusniger group]|uniref:Uncharacterized protein n=1 Tax=Streptomyces javensis TaxID=114698 RepID=A0ABS0RFK3_9ACTN|nr:hypothetical protein [Streptomyces javensis]MBI0315820.1 hypothetical protein [Streptomyces javensis]
MFTDHQIDWVIVHLNGQWTPGSPPPVKVHPGERRALAPGVVDDEVDAPLATSLVMYLAGVSSAEA